MIFVLGRFRDHDFRREQQSRNQLRVLRRIFQMDPSEYLDWLWQRWLASACDPSYLRRRSSRWLCRRLALSKGGDRICRPVTNRSERPTAGGCQSGEKSWGPPRPAPCRIVGVNRHHTADIKSDETVFPSGPFCALGIVSGSRVAYCCYRRLDRCWVNQQHLFELGADGNARCRRARQAPVRGRSSWRVTGTDCAVGLRDEE